MLPNFFWGKGLKLNTNILNFETLLDIKANYLARNIYFLRIFSFIIAKLFPKKNIYFK